MNKKDSDIIGSTNNNIHLDLENNKEKHKNNNSKFTKKLLFFDFLMLIFIFAGVFLIRKSLSLNSAQNITFKESSNLNYNVKLKANEFYEDESLGKGRVYIASLIDKVDINFNYLFEVDRNSYLNFEYDIIGKLVITDNNDNSKIIFDKEYTLLKNTKEEINNSNYYKINKDISIDYDYYNSLANKFRIKYGLDAACNLIVYLNIHKTNDNKNRYILNDNSAMSLTIPLSKKAINITMDYKEVNKTSKLIREKELKVNSKLKMTLGIISMILGLFFAYKYIKMLLKLRVKRSKYDKYIRRILNEYDRLIVETSTPPTLKGNNIIKIKKFQELLDVRDNLRLPIKYYIISNHKESYFYITHDDEIYLYAAKSSDFDQNG
ncbi:MAG: DUF5305 family protein [Bacilli bacterium]|nr:DUF5305 family protein [Bacilli bacterium]